MTQPSNDAPALIPRRVVFLYLLAVVVFLYPLTFILPFVPIYQGDNAPVYLLNASRMAHGEVLYRDIFECAIEHISVELVGLSVVGHQQIRPAILIVVEHGHTQRLGAAVEYPAARRYILKRAIAAYKTLAGR